MRSIAILLCLILMPLSVFAANDDCPNKKGYKPTKKELKAILANHQNRLNKIGNLTILEPSEAEGLFNDPLHANLCNANLTNAEFRNANLTYADLTNANLTNADFRKANLTNAEFRNANLTNANFAVAKLTGAFLGKADLTNAYLYNANLTGADLSEANLTDAILNYANLTNANLTNANLTNANLNYANLTNANLTNTNLTGAHFWNTNLSHAKLRLTNVAKAMFIETAFNNTTYEPSSEGIPLLDHLELNELFKSTYKSPRGFVALRNAYRKNGKKEEANKITRLLNQRETTKLITPESEEKSVSIFNRIEWAFKLVFFDLPTDWGVKPGRALKILVFGIGIFMIFYLVALQAPEADSGIWRMRSKERLRDKDKQDEELIKPNGFWSALPTALYFSVLSAFHFGWKDLNVGSWIHRIQHKEYTFRATGWVRTVAGIQSLMSVYLVAMWALTYFGRPFD